MSTGAILMHHEEQDAVACIEHAPRDMVPIELLTVGRRVITYLREEMPVEPGEPESIDPVVCRHIRLSLRQPDGLGADIELLRSLEWIAEHDAHVGGTICLHMPEMGVRGQAEVLAIDACPPLESGEGRLITGTFRHASGDVYDLKLEGETEPIGVTGSHPFWSVDRGNWVSVVDLQVGETLKTLEGTTRVESLETRQNDEPVYNLEVEGDPCYRVGQQGILVHNSSVGSVPAPSGATNCCPEIKRATATEFELVNPSKTSNFIIGELVSGGQVSFIVENLPKEGTGCPGKWMFDLMMGHFGSSVTAVQGVWTGPLSDNLKQVNALTAGGMSLEAAAKGTWTGKQAAAWGYTQVQELSSKMSAGSYTQVHVLFKK